MPAGEAPVAFPLQGKMTTDRKPFKFFSKWNLRIQVLWKAKENPQKRNQDSSGGKREWVCACACMCVCACRLKQGDTGQGWISG